MKRIVLCGALVFAFSAAGYAQAPTLDVGKAYSLAWTQPTVTIPVGAALDYRVYVDNVRQTVTIPAAVSGTITVAMPAFTAAGNKVLKVSALWRITDTTKFTCPTTGCPEAYAPDLAITVKAVTPPTPPILPPPGNFRLVIPVSIAEDGKLVLDWTAAKLEPVK